MLACLLAAELVNIGVVLGLPRPEPEIYRLTEIEQILSGQHQGQQGGQDGGLPAPADRLRHRQVTWASRMYPTLRMVRIREPRPAPPSSLRRMRLIWTSMDRS